MPILSGVQWPHNRAKRRHIKLSIPGESGFAAARIDTELDELAASTCPDWKPTLEDD